MNGVDFLNNLIDEIDRAREMVLNFCDETSARDELVSDIRESLEMYYDYADSLESVLEDVVID